MYFLDIRVVEQSELCETYEARQDAEGSLRPMREDNYCDEKLKITGHSSAWVKRLLWVEVQKKSPVENFFNFKKVTVSKRGSVKRSERAL